MDVVDALPLTKDEKTRKRSSVFVAAKYLLAINRRPTQGELQTICTTDLPSLSARFDDVVAQALPDDCKDTQNAFSRIRQTLRLVGLPITEANGRPLYSEEWGQVISASQPRGRDVLPALARWCTVRNISPDKLTTDTFARFVNEQRTMPNNSSLDARTRDIVLHWHRIRRVHPELGLPEIENPNGRFRARDDIPPRLKREIDIIAHHNARFGAVPSPVSTSSFKRTCQRLLTRYHKKHGTYPTSLQELADTDIAADLRYITLEASNRSDDDRYNPSTAAVERTLLAIAAYFQPDCMEPLTRQYVSRATCASKAKTDILRHFTDFRRAAEFLSYPDAIYASVMHRTEFSAAEADTLGAVLGWALLIEAPGWTGTLLQLAFQDHRITQHPTRPAEKLFDLSRPQGRIRTPIKYNWSERTAGSLDFYQSHIRPAAAPRTPGSPLLTLSDGRPMCSTTLAGRIRAVTGTYLRVELTPTDIRDIGTMIFLAKKSHDPRDAAQWSNRTKSNQFEQIVKTVTQWRDTGVFKNWPDQSA